MKLLLLCTLLFASVATFAITKPLKVTSLLASATATGAGSTFGPIPSGERSYQAVVTGTGAVTATVLIQVSNNVSLQGWATLGTITLSGTTTATDGFVSNGAWAYERANVSAITGTGATVDVTLARE